MNQLAEQDKNTQMQDEFSGATSMVLAETAGMAMAAKAKASVEAGFLMAMRNPRDLDNVRIQVLKDCKRPLFAEKARFSVPRGKKKVGNQWVQNYIEGPSIRLMESIARAMRNIRVESVITFEDKDKQILEVSAVDMESNIWFASTVSVEKVVERSTVKEGTEILGKRLNSYGDQVYLIRATKDDVVMMVGSAVSKAARTLLKRIVPADIVEEAEEAVKSTMANQDKTDPTAARKKLADSFAELGVMPADLKKYLGHELDLCGPAEMAELRGLYIGIKDGRISWKDAMAERTKPEEEQKKQAGSKADNLSQKLQAKVDTQGQEEPIV